MLMKDLLKQSLPLLVLLGIGEIFAGTILGGFSSTLRQIPGLLILIPAIISLRGNISTAFGSRLGSAFHLGLISRETFWGDDLRQNVIGSLFLSVVMSVLLGVFAFLTSAALGFHVNIVQLIIIALIAGVVSGVVQQFIAISVILLAFKRGYDPDNVTGPVLATVGDIITILCMFGAAFLVMGV